MNIKSLTIVMVFFVALAIAVPTQSIAGNLPETPITKILNYKSGLDLSDTQAKQLTLINNNIVNKMLQLKTQAYAQKSEIDKVGNNWEKMDDPKIKSAVKEYFQCQADMKNLEFEAMAKASQVLSADQIKKFSQLVSIELIMISMDKDMASAY